MRVKIVPSLLTLLLLAAAPLGAQEGAGFEGLHESAPRGEGEAPSVLAAKAGTLMGEVLRDGKPLRVTERHGEKIDFRAGRDNLGFANLSGAVRLGGMAGNCYTMAFVSKLFFEDAEYLPSSRPERSRRGFSPAELATHLAGDRKQRLKVKDFESLHDLSYDSSFGEDEVFDHLARVRGLDRSKQDAAPGLSGRQKMIVELVQLISTVHYLHYLQYQAGSFVETIARSNLSGSGQVQQVTKRELGRMAAELDAGRTSLLLMLGAKEVYGHVVLAYGIAKTADATYIEVYDSNVQYGTETRPSVLEIDRDGRVAGYHRLESDGTLRPHSIYDGDSWFSDRDALAIMRLEDLTLDAENRQALARKAEALDHEAAYLMAGGQLLRRLTERSPEESTLRADTLQFLRNVQSIQASLDDEGFDSKERLGPDASVAEINAFLARHADAGIRTAFPYALPEGMSLTGTTVQLDENDPNAARVGTTLTLEKDGPVHALAGVLERSTALAGYTDLSGWVEAVRKNVGPTKIHAQLEFSIRKDRMPSGFVSTYGVVPALLRSHVVLGDIAPSERSARDHQLEISEKTLQGGLATVLSQTGLIGHDYKFEYVLVPARYTPGIFGRQLQITPQIDRTGRVRLRGLTLDLLDPARAGDVGKLRLTADAYAFVAVNPVLSDRGVSGEGKPVHADLQFYTYDRLPEGQWHLYGDVHGTLAFDDGLLNLGSFAVTQLADKAFPFFRDLINSYIREALTGFVELKRPLAIRSLSVSTKRLSLNTGEALLDVSALASRLIAGESPVRLKSVKIRDDRLIVTTDYK